ncbi:hypothetical protein ASG76_00390 [Nocardioides sp. Soil774]|uniref:sensor histidine kinase n=1 Tax=Nocardioides sp. Soil774 TaxID=1736408 RepID=UPI0006F3B6E0|nr:HAMP domain-containing sensor histidine kinase [Nocardioides sp. Soil774]KRE97228.1 hypothetical protein ASG76_00390 [Nocardioides sp. Soil774]
MTQPAALQDTSAPGSISRQAAQLAGLILDGEFGFDEAISRTAGHLLSNTRVDAVVASLTKVAPEDPSGWTGLGGRAWVREWSQPGTALAVLPPPGAGPEAALTMPWLSQFARANGMAALVDIELLPDEAEQDRRELTRTGARSLLATTLISRGDMFGSISAGSSRAGPWPTELLGDLRLLNSAIVSRIMLEHSRRALAEAIDAGTEAQLAYQHFLGSVGHELRTPLSAVLGYTEVLLDDARQSPDTTVSAALLRDGPIMVRACERVLTLVDDLLGAGRVMASDDQRLEVGVADAVADVVHWHRVPAQAAGVQMTVDVDPSATVWGHPSGVRQALANLVGNALTHHRPGGGHVHLSTERLRGESGAEMVRIIVRDDGPGLEADQLEHAFEPFTRFAAPGTTGSGLGLSMSRTIAERDGGAVRGESTPGVGSSFWLELPVHGS